MQSLLQVGGLVIYVSLKSIWTFSLDFFYAYFDSIIGLAEPTSEGEGVPVVDKLPPECRHVDNCGDCVPCEEIAGKTCFCDG
jgi:hypothetical protein